MTRPAITTVMRDIATRASSQQINISTCIKDASGAMANALEQHLLAELELRLSRWGLWWYRGNQLQINLDSGRITRSPAATVMQYAPFPDKTGYAHEHPVEVDEADAEILHREIIEKCTRRQVRALTQYYVYGNAPPTNSERLARFKAKRRLLGLNS